MAEMKQIGIDVDVYRVIEFNRLSFAEVENDILRRLLLGDSAETSTNAVRVRPSRQAQERVRGDWVVHVGSTSSAEGNLKASYCSALRQLEARKSGFLQAFSQLRGRSRRYVARVASDLYENSKHLANDYALELVPGWYVDTNLSEEQVAQRMKAAAEVAGLNYGTSLAIREGGRLI